MSDLPPWDIDLIEKCVLRVSTNAELREEDRQRIELYLPMLKKAHGDMLALVSTFAGPGTVELTRRHLRTIETSAFFLGIATHVSESGKQFAKAESVNSARSSKATYHAAKEQELLQAIIDEAREQGIKIAQSKKCAENLLAGSKRKGSKEVKARLSAELLEDGWPSWRTIQRAIKHNLENLKVAGLTRGQ